MEVFVVVNLAVDLVLDDLVFMGLDYLVRNSWFQSVYVKESRQIRGATSQKDK